MLCVLPYSLLKTTGIDSVFWSAEGSYHQELEVMEVFLEEVGNPTSNPPGFSGRKLNSSSLFQQARCDQHHHDRDCAEDDRPEPSAEAAAEGPGHSAVWASPL